MLLYNWKQILDFWMHVLGNLEVSYHKVLPYINLRNIISTQWTLQMVNFMNFNHYISINVHLILSIITNNMLFKDTVLPSDNVLPNSCEEAKKLLKMFGVEYISYQLVTMLTILNDYKLVWRWNNYILINIYTKKL